MAICASNDDYGSPSMTFKGQLAKRSDLIWRSKDIPGQENPYVNEWNDLLHAIRNDTPYNEVERGVMATVTSSLGRMSAHTGLELDFDDMLNCEQEFAPDVDKLTFDSPAPVRADKNGIYPQPMPGLYGKHEFEVKAA